MNPPEESLGKALRELAAASPQGAPPELGARLGDAFARHHARRRRRRMALALSVAACLVVWLAWWGLSRRPRQATAAKAQPLAVQPAPAGPAAQANAPATAQPASVARVVRPQMRTSRKPRTKARVAARRPHAMAANDFVALPPFDPAIPIRNPRIVRVELPGSALQLVGYPVDEELLRRRVLTDMLVGQDGVPYAVRLIESRADH